MITTYRVEGGQMRVGDLLPALPGPGEAGAPTPPIWIDLVQPTMQEERLVEQLIGVELPTREEMQEIEASSRLYREGGVLFMTATFLYGADSGEIGSTPITFVLTPQCLVTIRYATPKAFGVFAARAAKNPALAATLTASCSACSSRWSTGLPTSSSGSAPTWTARATPRSRQLRARRAPRRRRVS